MVPSSVTPGVVATAIALAAIDDVVGDKGPLMFFQSGGCCDGSLPMCFAEGELVVSDNDVLLGHVGGHPFYIDHRQYELWKHTQLILDVAEGDPEGFSMAAGENKHFVIRSRVFDAEELANNQRSSGCEPRQIAVPETKSASQ